MPMDDSIPVTKVVLLHFHEMTAKCTTVKNK